MNRGKLLIFKCIVSIAALMAVSCNQPTSTDVFEGKAGACGALRDSSSVRTPKLNKPPSVGTLPSTVDLSANMPPVGDQGNQSSCVAFACAYAAKTLSEKPYQGWDVNMPRCQFSPSFVYNQAKNSHCNDSSSAQGMYVSAALELLKNKGCDYLEMFPYTDTDCDAKPDSLSLSRAALYKINEWYALSTDITDYKTALAAGYPVIISVYVYPDFDNLYSGNPVYDNLSGNSRGYHAVCIVGYDDAKGAFKFANSWGADWGLGGYGWISYSIIPDAKLGCDGYYYVNYQKGRVARDIDIGADGTKWIVGTEGTQGRIYFYNGTSWELFPSGEAVKISVDPSGVLWIIKSNNTIHRWNGSSWVQMPGTAQEIDIGADGSVYIVGVGNSENQEGQIFKWTGSSWELLPNSSAMKISVDPSGNPWIITSDNNIHRWTGSSWEQLPETAQDIDIGADGSVYIIGTGNSTNPHGRILKWGGSYWSLLPRGAAMKITVDPNGIPWVITIVNSVHYWDGYDSWILK